MLILVCFGLRVIHEAVKCGKTNELEAGLYLLEIRDLGWGISREFVFTLLGTLV